MSSDDWTPSDSADPAPESEWDERSRSNQRIRLVKGGGIVFEPNGFRIIEARGIKRSPLTPYESMTHVAATDRALLVGTTMGLTIIRARDFPDPETGPKEAREALLARLAARPDGDFGMARVAELEAMSGRKTRDLAVWGVVLLCLLGTLGQLSDPTLESFGSFVPDLFSRGELWRAVTAHFLHGAPRMPIHLAFNVGGLLVLGHLVERPLGTAKTIVVFVLGGVGAIVGATYADYEVVVGASGLVTALAGAMLALELHHPDRLPAYWRLPRRLFIGALLAQFLVVDQILSSYLAGGAHLGGFAGGYAAVWFVGGPVASPSHRTQSLRFAAMSGVLLVLVGLVPLVSLARHDEEALERHALRLLNTGAALGFLHDNAVAWFIATEGEPSEMGLQVAVELADRAVLATGRRDPNILDTLAEALFQAGDVISALLTIDEAIRLAPHEPYFHEQRRRFTGERAADDRPAPPGEEGLGGSADDGFDDLPIDPDAPALTL